MTEGPISTPRRPAPRSIGTPIILTFLTISWTPFGGRQRYRQSNCPIMVWERQEKLQPSKASPRVIWLISMSGLGGTRCLVDQLPDGELEIVEVCRFDQIGLSSCAEPGLNV